jgi:hypothetical protein
MNPMNPLVSIPMAALLCAMAGAAEKPVPAAAAAPSEYAVHKVDADLSKPPQPDAGYWTGVPETEVNLLAQMMVNPKPAKAQTEKLKVRIVHNGKYVAFRLRWSDKEKSEAGRVGEFSDAVALEFPVLDHAAPPPIFMGSIGNPVHVFHWRAQYQHDEEFGKKTMKEIYPNLNSDMYPNEFADRGSLKPATEGQIETFSPAKAEGNPQSYRKKAVDEIQAEGFGTSVVTPGGNSTGRGEWKDGEWVVVISRALDCPGDAAISAAKSSAFGAAVWQGGADEVGSRKSLTMAWTRFRIEEK